MSTRWTTYKRIDPHPQGPFHGLWGYPDVWKGNALKQFGKILAVLALVAATAAITYCVTVDQLGGGHPALAKVEEIRRYLDKYFIDEYDEQAVLAAADTAMGDAAAAAMLEATGDEWSYYVSAKDYRAFQEQSENAYVGIGVTILDHEDGFEISAVSPGGPADLGGVRVGDILVAVEGESVLTLGREETVARVRGEPGTPVSMTFLRDGKTLDLKLTRGSIETTVATLKMMDGIALIRIANFDRHAAEQTLQAIDEALSNHAKALVFDVRNDPGGYKDEMVQILDRLLPEGVIFRSRSYAGEEEPDLSDAACVELPMAVLVNEESYSAAEFFAAALQEYGAAKVVGTQTYGKGNFQWQLPLSDGSAVSISVGKYYTPKGVSLTGTGITPDIVVDLDDEQFYALYAGTLAPEDDPQLQAALAAVREAP